MNHPISKADLKSFHDKVYEQADKTIQYFILGYFVIGILLGFAHDTWGLALLMGGGSLGLYYVLRKFFGNTNFFRVVVSLLFWNFGLQFLLQMRGMYEFHFLFFISLTVLLFYEDWRAILPAYLYASITVIVIYYLQVNAIEIVGLSESITYNSFSLVLHLFIMVVYFGLCFLWAQIQREQTADSGANYLVMTEKLKYMDANIQFATEISQGNLEVGYNSGDSDELGKSLQDMRENLVDAKNREETEKFINLGMTEIGEILRNNINELDVLCDQVIAKLVAYMKVNQGGLFVLNNADPNNQFLELKACRAFEKKKYLENKIPIGTGMIGVVFEEGETRFLKEVPNDYINIRSGMGGANPRSLLIVPLKSNESVVGVIELASFEIFSETEILFLEKVGESIASTIISAKINQKTTALLEESEIMTEQMRAQEEEMRQNMEELQATQEEMARKQNEIETKENNIRAMIDNTDETIFAIDTEYIVTVVNRPLKEKYANMGIKLEPGENILNILPSDKRSYWKDRYDKVLSGQASDETTETVTDGKTYYNHRKELPIRNNEGEVIGASVISREITEMVEQSKQVENQKAMLDSIVNSTRNSILVIDRNYCISMMNDVLVNRYKGTEYEKFKVGSSVVEMLGDIWEIWKKRYDDAMEGTKQNIILKSTVNGEDKFREYFISPVINSENKIIGCSIVSHEIESVDQEKVVTI